MKNLKLGILILSVVTLISDGFLCLYSNHAPTWSNVLSTDFALVMAWLWLYHSGPIKEQP